MLIMYGAVCECSHMARLAFQQMEEMDRSGRNIPGWPPSRSHIC